MVKIGGVKILYTNFELQSQSLNARCGDYYVIEGQNLTSRLESSGDITLK